MAQRSIQCRRSYRTDHYHVHLCYIEAQGFRLADAGEPARCQARARYRCSHCGRTAQIARRLCVPIPLQGEDRDDTDQTGDQTAPEPG